MKRAKKESQKVISTQGKKAIEVKPGKAAGERSGDVQKLVQLFQVNLVELEHQNQELRITEEELEASRNKYVNLFDFSPTPYFALDPGGIIKEVNLSACKMFGIDRNKLISKNIHGYIPFDEKKIFDAFMKSVFNSAVQQSCKVKMITQDKRVFHVLLEGVKSDDTIESGERCQIALIDMTEYKKLEDAFKELSEELRLLKTGKDNIIG